MLLGGMVLPEGDSICNWNAYKFTIKKDYTTAADTPINAHHRYIPLGQQPGI